MRRLILGILIIAVVLLIIAMLTGFITLTSQGAFKAPEVNVSATPGQVPRIDVDTKKVVVGTTEANVGAPAIGIEQSTIKVPVIGIKDGAGEAGQNAAQNAQ